LKNLLKLLNIIGNFYSKPEIWQQLVAKTDDNSIDTYIPKITGQIPGDIIFIFLPRPRNLMKLSFISNKP